MRILISGAGIAGPTLAYWLLQYGMEPTLIEQAPRLRTGGYVIDFWGAGYDIAERMGLLPQLKQLGYLVKQVRVVDQYGRRAAGFSADVFERATQGRYISLRRGDLAASIFRKIEGKVETIFGDSIEQAEQNKTCVRVAFRGAGTREFDLLIGADGLHSKVRELVFGTEERFEKYMGYKVAAFESEGYLPRDELVYIMYTQPGQQIARFSMRDNRTTFLFVFRATQMKPGEEDSVDMHDTQAHKAELRRRFGNSGWECPRILDAMDHCNDLYFDRVSQIQMYPVEGLWTRGRVTLVGDAASCISLLGGQGSALAMIAAYILAGELHRARGDYSSAFSRYQDLFAPFVAQKQKASERFARAFVPRSTTGLFVRNRIMEVMNIPLFAKLAMGEGLLDRIVLPDC